MLIYIETCYNFFIGVFYSFVRFHTIFIANHLINGRLSITQFGILKEQIMKIFLRKQNIIAKFMMTIILIIRGLYINVFIDKENGLILYNEVFTAFRLIYKRCKKLKEKLLINFDDLMFNETNLFFTYNSIR